MKWVLICFYLNSCGNYAIDAENYYNTKAECDKEAAARNNHVEEENAKPPIAIHINKAYGCAAFLPST